MWRNRSVEEKKKGRHLPTLRRLEASQGNRIFSMSQTAVQHSLAGRNHVARASSGPPAALHCGSGRMAVSLMRDDAKFHGFPWVRYDLSP